MQRGWKTLLPVAILIAVIGYMYTQQHATREPVPSPTVTVAPAPSEASDETFLPPEARHTLALIASGGPFPHRQDGVVFGNYEHLLPAKPRGYYHE